MKHRYHEVIVAWSNGETIQQGYEGTWKDYADEDAPNFNSKLVKWRIKPKDIYLYYRNALMMNSTGEIRIVCIDSTDLEIMEKKQEYTEENPEFISWVNFIQFAIWNSDMTTYDYTTKGQ